MDKQKVIDYVMDTPENVNRQVLGYILDELEGEGEEGSVLPFPVYECDLVEDTSTALVVIIPPMNHQMTYFV